MKCSAAALGERSKTLNNKYWPFGQGHPSCFTGVGELAALVGWCGRLMGGYFCRAWTPLRAIRGAGEKKKKNKVKEVFLTSCFECEGVFQVKKHACGSESC